MVTEEATPTEHTKACIFCFRTDLETVFSEEHIIPQSIGGRLVLDQVCAKCNGDLGHEVDTEVLKLPEILQALETLSIPHNRQGILRSYYDVKAETDDGIRKVRATEHGFEPLPQQLPDGSILTPDHRVIEDLSKRVRRDERLKNAGLTTEEIEEQLAALLAAYQKCKPGETVDWPALGYKLVRRQEKPTIQISSRGRPQITRFLAKVAYEFLFFLGGREFLLNPQVSEPLFKAIQGTDTDIPVGTMRIDPPADEFSPVHVIELLTDRGLTEIYIVLFGHISYRVSTTRLSSQFLGLIEERLKIPNIIGVHFQQRLPNELGFWVVTSDGQYIWPGGT